MKKLIKAIIPANKYAHKVNRLTESCLSKYYEKKLGIKTKGLFIPNGRNSRLYDYKNHPYEPAKYFNIIRILRHLKPGKDDVLLDFGCGQGRIVCFAAARSEVKKVVGVELYKQLVDDALENINNLKLKKAEIDVYCADAANFTEIDDVTIFIFFNPFGEVTMKRVLENISNSLKTAPRTIHIAYWPTPNLAHLFEKTAYLTSKEVLRTISLSHIYIYSNKEN